MKKYLALAAASLCAVAAAQPASAAVVIYHAANPGGAVTLTPAGPGAVSSGIGFDVLGAGAFTATFTFTNPFTPAAAQGSASFNFDPDVITFTSGVFSGGTSSFVVTPGPTGTAIQVDLASMSPGAHTLTLMGTLTPGVRGNSFARIGGSITLTDAAVPEPATWAMFILGFGAVGSFMRRRNAMVRNTRASLTFA